MPIVRVSLIEGRDDATKRRLIAEVTATVARVTGSPVGAVRVLLEELPPLHWGVAGVPRSDDPGRPAPDPTEN